MNGQRVDLALDCSGGREDDVVFHDGGASRVLRENGRIISTSFPCGLMLRKNKVNGLS